MTTNNNRAQSTLRVPAKRSDRRLRRAAWPAIAESLAGLSLEELARVVHDGVQPAVRQGRAKVQLELDDYWLNDPRLTGHERLAQGILRILDRRRDSLHFDWCAIKVPPPGRSQVVRESRTYDWVYSAMLTPSPECGRPFALRVVCGDHVTAEGNIKGGARYGPQLLVAVLPDDHGDPAAILTCAFGRAAEGFASNALSVWKVAAGRVKKEVGMILLEAPDPVTLKHEHQDLSEEGARDAHRGLAVLKRP